MFHTGKVKPYDASDFAMQNSRDILEDIKLKLYAQCGDIDPNVLKVDLCGVNDVFQAKDCSGGNIGTPQKALRVITMNKQIVQICNVAELAAAIAAGGTYNTPDYILLAPGNNITIAADTVHSLSYKVIGGNGTVKIGAAGTVITVVDGESDGWTATSLLNQSFLFTATTGTIKIVIIKA